MSRKKQPSAGCGFATSTDTIKCSACATASQVSTLQICSGCRVTAYCGPACQREHWRVHKKECKGAAVAAFQRDLADAVKGNAFAQYSVSARLKSGRGVEVNATEALVWLQRAAEAGCALAQHDLAFRYLYGTGTAVDATQALSWFR